MRLLIIAAASLAVVSCASLSLEDLEFHAWKLKFGKSYRSPKEEAQRKLTWLSTRPRVLAHNILADQGIKTYRMGMNQFSDMDNEEYRNTVLLRSTFLSNETKTLDQRGINTSRQKGGTKLPDSVDWRKKACVTFVKDQTHHCGSCWAFSTTGALESHTCIKYGRLPSLSEQQLVDCSRSYGNMGCNGGYIDLTYQYVIKSGGVDTEDSYPYQAEDDNCRFKPSDVGASCRGYTKVKTPGNESALQEAVANEGPVSVAIDAERDFRFYESGVYDEPSCSRTRLNHAMLVVGYGTEDGQDYWLVKNSWSASWGEEGYIKMSRNQDNQCGIASYAFYPEV
ncbi:procathepsin L-like [Clupea harengus]|uniref:Procathepsin L-like n=1 Tax=Clupea harengus TaxID=7950 RepID=A0A6P3W8C7_CLUHA|nr:procathepsin L-like [Clupea harengus]XP_031435999.1 procathepsin L-like [Clupea harengus]